MSGSVIVAGARTPIGKLLGGLKDKSAADLGGVAIAGALEKAGVSGDQVDYVIMGQVIQAGAGQNPARTAAVAGGIPMNVPSITINKVCLSGINAIALADQLIRAGEVDIVVAGGMESMTQAPHLLPKSREGFKYGDTALVDSMAYDALWDQATAQAMGMLTEQCNTAADNLTREEQDAFAARSHQRAAEAWKNGVFDDEVVPGDGEDPRRRHPGHLRRGRARRHHGRVAGQAASGVQQGRHHHRRLGVPDLRRRLRGRDDEQGEGRGARPGVARRDRRARPGGRPRLDPPAAARQRHREGVREGGHHPRRPRPGRVQRGVRRGRHRLGPRRSGISEDKVNVNGGAIALGHPVGMSGARIVLHLALELKRRGGGVGAAALCGGGGQGDALIVRVPSSASRTDRGRAGPQGSSRTSVSPLVERAER